MLGNDFFQQHSKLWNVPLAIAQRVKQPALGVLGADLECRIEGAARGDHAQLFVEHKNRLADSVDNALSERPRIRNGGKLFPDARDLHKAPQFISRLRQPRIGKQPGKRPTRQHRNKAARVLFKIDRYCCFACIRSEQSAPA